ncbi:hypothetical protein CSAL01_06603 [Colletotrichum salicis]|uniref:Uncharacterized protein n=1 Tax=Colletotrichum salicis TaxID=1209931 RepID=A0A135ULN0_9PEZI|nr:hypothetical protein CSAL01_06603 [Colletotrichum salicis]
MSSIRIKLWTIPSGHNTTAYGTNAEVSRGRCGGSLPRDFTSARVGQPCVAGPPAWLSGYLSIKAPAALKSNSGSQDVIDTTRNGGDQKRTIAPWVLVTTRAEKNFPFYLSRGTDLWVLRNLEVSLFGSHDEACVSWDNDTVLHVLTTDDSTELGGALATTDLRVPEVSGAFEQFGRVPP